MNRHRLKELQTRSRDRLGMHFRTFTLTLAFATLFIGGTGGAACLSLIALSGSSLSPQAKTWFTLLGMMTGFGASVIALYTLAPIWIKFSYRTCKIEPGVFLIEDDAYSRSFGKNAVVTGLPFFSKWIRPTVFVSRSVINSCSPNEMKAILAHEKAHIECNHLWKRVILIFAVFSACVFATSAALLTLTYLGFADLAQNVSLLTSIIPIVLTSYAVKRQRNRQEFEADRIAISEFGADPLSLISAIEKLKEMNLGKTEKIVDLRLTELRKKPEEPNSIQSRDASIAA